MEKKMKKKLKIDNVKDVREFIDTVCGFKEDIYIVMKDGSKVNAKSTYSVFTAGVENISEVEVVGENVQKINEIFNCICEWIIE